MSSTALQTQPPLPPCPPSTHSHANSQASKLSKRFQKENIEQLLGFWLETETNKHEVLKEQPVPSSKFWQERRTRETNRQRIQMTTGKKDWQVGDFHGEDRQENKIDEAEQELNGESLLQCDWGASP